MGVRPKAQAQQRDYYATHHSDPRWANSLQEEDRDVASVAAGPASGTALLVALVIRAMNVCLGSLTRCSLSKLPPQAQLVKKIKIHPP
ncbi:hypothetical protein GY632_5388 [Trichophyton interdigitale]|nr:hypothetical protein GY632_5388 [Trichophyton interdigitale]